MSLLCALALGALLQEDPTAYVRKRRRSPDGARVYCVSRDVLDIGSAKALARDLGGYLVSIETEEEDRWILAEYGGDRTQFIGLEGDCSTWASGAAVGYASWFDKPPDPRRGTRYAVRAKCPDGAKPEDCRERPGTWSTVRGDAL